MAIHADINGDQVLLGTRVTIENTVEEEFMDMIDEIQEWQEAYLEELAREVAQEASNLAPHRTGTLAASIYWQKADPENMAPSQRTNKYRTEYKIGTDKYYGLWMEYGWTTREGKRMPARPFLRPALYNVGVKLDRESISRELNKFLASRRSG